MSRPFFSSADRDSLTVLVSVLGMLTIAVIVGSMTAHFRNEARTEWRDRGWFQVESRYDVVVLDRTVAPPRVASQGPVVAAMRVAGQTRQCSVLVVQKEPMVFCGTRMAEAPRRR